MSEEYELKIGVFSDERLQVNDLLKYLQAQLNDMVSSQAKKLSPGGKTSQKFTVAFQQMMHSDIDQQDYVGFLLIYNNAQFQSIEFVKRIVSELAIRSFGETFLILVEMDAKNKVNLANQQGQLLATKYKAEFIKLSFENSGELLQLVGRYISQMLQSYYNPASVIGEEDEHNYQQDEGQHQHQQQHQPHYQQHKQPAPLDYELNYISRDKEEDQAADQPLFEDDVQEGLLERVTRERQSRIKDITQQEKDIDANIQNLQKVLENMDVHIRSKVQTDWFNNLKHSIYSRAEKESESYSKIKLTQHFLKQSADPARPQRIPIETILIRKRPVLLRLQLAFNKMQIVVEVHPDSTYLELSKLSLRKIGLRLTDKNVSTMRTKIEEKIGAFVSQLQRSIATIQEQKLARRRILK